MLDVSDYATASYSKSVVRGLHLRFGAMYSDTLTNAIILRAGAVYEYAQDLDNKRSASVEQRDDNNIPIQGSIDTLFSNRMGTITLPTKMGIGISIEKQYHYSIGVDVYQMIGYLLLFLSL